MEVWEDLPFLDTIVVPVGGGGLISGVATYAKQIHPSIRIIGVQAEGNDSYVRRPGPQARSRRPPAPPRWPTVFPAARPGQPILSPSSSGMWMSWSASARRRSSRPPSWWPGRPKLVGEPSACVGVAAAMAKKFCLKPQEKVCFSADQRQLGHRDPGANLQRHAGIRRQLTTPSQNPQKGRE